MTVLNITRRPVVLETRASDAMLTDILARIATIHGRASLYGIDNPVEAALLMTDSTELAFAEGYYRSGYITPQTDPDNLTGWSFERTGVATAQEAGGSVVSFAADVARITSRGLLVEPQRTNQAVWSNFSASGWAAVLATLTPAVATAPDGTATAAGLSTDMTAAADHFIVQSIGGLGAGHQTFSAWVKAAERDEVALIAGGVISFTAYFDLTGDGSVTSATGGCDARIEKGVDGWYRVSARATATAGTAGFYVMPALNGSTTINGNGATALLIWGGQVEGSSEPTSVIATTSGTATRSIDLPELSIDLDRDFSVVVEAEMSNTSADDYILSINGATLDQRLTLARLSGSAIVALVNNGGGERAWNGPAKAGARTVRIAVSYGFGGGWFSVDGGAPVEIDQPRPLGLSTVRPGYIASTYPSIALTGYVRRLLLIPRTVTNTQLQALSS